MAGLLGPLADVLAKSPALLALLKGAPAGHAAHPFLTDLPLGAWTSATVLDLVGGPDSRAAAQTLVGFGILTSVPAAASGLAEWTHTDERSGRVGALHAAGNAVALGLYGLSWLARRTKHRGAGTGFALLGFAVGSASAFLGGHLAAARNVASRDEEFEASLPAEHAGAELGDSMLT